nr:ribonuclease H-like domain-containing protein [Tanacetum cinerariifolium]
MNISLSWKPCQGGSVDGVTTSLQLSRNSRPPMLDHQDKYMMKAQSTTSEFNAKTSDLDYCDSNFSVATLESVPKLVANVPKAICEPKVWSDAPIIKEYESYNDDEHVTLPSKEHEQPSFAFVNTVEHLKTPRVPRQHNMYSFNLKNIVPSGSLACLIAKATIDESTKWHRSMPQEPIVFNKDPGENSSQSPPHIDHHCCFGCGDSLDVPIISNLEPCHEQNVDEFPQTLPSFHPTCYSRDENSFAYDLTPNLFNDSPNVFNLPSQPLMYSYEFCGNDAQYSHDCPPQIPSCYDDDDDKESSTPLRDIIISECPLCIAITPVLSTKDSLVIGDEYLDTIPEKESDEFIESSVENLIPNPSKSEDELTTNHFLMRTFQRKSIRTLFLMKIISIKIDLHHLNAESDLIESLLNQDSSIISSSKIDSLLDEFAGEFILLKSIPPGIDEADYDPEEEIHLIEKLLYDNSSPRPPEEIDFENSDAVIESFSPSPIPFEDSVPFMEEIELFLTSDGSIPPGIDSDYSDLKGIIFFQKD